MHPFHEHMDHKKQKSRVGHIAHGYASGGAVHHHSDAKEDEALIRKEVKPSALKHHHGKPHKAAGGAVAPRQDKVQRARGGRTKHKGHTSVNVIVAPQGGHPNAPMPMPSAGPAPAPAPAPMMPRPGVPTAAGAGAPMPGGMPSPGLGPRRDGGRATYARGGGVKSGPAWEEGRKAGTQVQHNDSGKNDQKNVGRGRVVTFRTGGAVEAPKHHGPKFKGGAGGGAARVEKGRRANRDYVKA